MQILPEKAKRSLKKLSFYMPLNSQSLVGSLGVMVDSFTKFAAPLAARGSPPVITMLSFACTSSLLSKSCSTIFSVVIESLTSVSISGVVPQSSVS